MWHLAGVRYLSSTWSSASGRPSCALPAVVRRASEVAAWLPCRSEVLLLVGWCRCRGAQRACHRAAPEREAAPRPHARHDAGAALCWRYTVGRPIGARADLPRPTSDAWAASRAPSRTELSAGTATYGSVGLSATAASSCRASRHSRRSPLRLATVLRLGLASPRAASRLVRSHLVQLFSPRKLPLTSRAGLHVSYRRGKLGACLLLPSRQPMTARLPLGPGSV